MNQVENTRPIVHVLRVRQQDVVQDRLLDRRVRTPVRQQAQPVRSAKDHRVVRAD